jgi:hypothetical protein
VSGELVPCGTCLKGCERADLRPYGPEGGLICFVCAFATPEAAARTRAAFDSLTEATGAVTPLIAIGGSNGPTSLPDAIKELFGGAELDPDIDFMHMDEEELVQRLRDDPYVAVIKANAKMSSLKETGEEIPDALFDNLLYMAIEMAKNIVNNNDRCEHGRLFCEECQKGMELLG